MLNGVFAFCVAPAEYLIFGAFHRRLGTGMATLDDARVMEFLSGQVSVVFVHLTGVLEGLEVKVDLALRSAVSVHPRVAFDILH